MTPRRLSPAAALVAGLALNLAACKGEPPAGPEGHAPAPAAPPAAPTEEDIVAAAFAEAMNAGGEAYPADLSEIRRRKELRVGMLNNAASYFIYRGQQVGFQYELAELLAARLEVRLRVVVPSRPEELRQLLAERRVDVVPLDGADASQDAKVSATNPLITSQYVLVQRKDEAPITAVAQLAGRAIHVRPGSRYRPTLERLRQQVPTLRLVDAPEDIESEDLIDQVASGAIPLTVVNSVLLGVELTYRDDVRGTLVLEQDQPLVYAVHQEAPELAARLRAFVDRERAGPEYAALYAKYFENPKRMQELHAGEAGTSGALSPYDDVARRAAGEAEIDWRLVLAQMYQESRYDPQARSWAGAIGLMQLMPVTAKELGVQRLDDPDDNVRGGVRYMRRLMDRFDPNLPVRQRVRFALASYNAGYGHVADARRLAKQQKLDPDRWFGNVEKAIQLLEKPRYHRRAAFGYCRGREPAQYVSRIQAKYEAFVALAPEAKAALSGE